MADQKISEFTELTSLAGEDLLNVVDDPRGTPVNKKITTANALLNLPTKLKVNAAFEANTNQIRISTTSTPANNATATAGNIRWDSSYIYVATGANSWKRVALSEWDS